MTRFKTNLGRDIVTMESMKDKLPRVTGDGGEVDLDLNLSLPIDSQANDCAKVINKTGQEQQLGLLERFASIVSKLDPDLCYSSGIKYKSELDDCGYSVDGHAKGNGWQIRIQWEHQVHLLWSPNLRALLESAIEFLESRVTL